MALKLGLFLDLRNPPPWERPWVTHVAQTIERVVAAERDGIDAVWLSEHHQFSDGYLPQPLAFACALAARTERIRIGTAIMIAPLHQPAHLAEQAALADIISTDEAVRGHRLFAHDELDGIAIHPPISRFLRRFEPGDRRETGMFIGAPTQIDASQPSLLQRVRSGIDHADWIILGGESGPKARPMHPEWAREVRDLAISANVPLKLLTCSRKFLMALKQKRLLFVCRSRLLQSLCYRLAVLMQTLSKWGRP